MNVARKVAGSSGAKNCAALSRISDRCDYAALIKIRRAFLDNLLFLYHFSGRHWM